MGEDTAGIRAPRHCFWAPKKIFPCEFAIRNIPWAPGDALGRAGEEMGFDFVAAGPMVRSSYRAGELFVKNILRKEVAEVAGVADTTAELDLASLVQGSEARRGKLAAAMRGS